MPGKTCSFLPVNLQLVAFLPTVTSSFFHVRVLNREQIPLLIVSRQARHLAFSN